MHEWLQNRTEQIEEEDLIKDALQAELQNRGQRPQHALFAASDKQAELNRLQQALADLQDELALQKQDVASAYKDIVKQEEDIRCKEEHLQAERMLQQQRLHAREQYPQPPWLKTLDGTINVAVVGNSGNGKSLLINKIRRLRPGAVNWAPVGVNDHPATPMKAKQSNAKQREQCN